MNRILETSKGRFVITDNTQEINRWINNGRFLCINHLNRLSEKEAYEVTGKKANPKDDLFRLLESQGIEITNNTYIFKL